MSAVSTWIGLVLALVVIVVAMRAIGRTVERRWGRIWAEAHEGAARCRFLKLTDGRHALYTAAIEWTDDYDENTRRLHLAFLSLNEVFRREEKSR